MQWEDGLGKIWGWEVRQPPAEVSFLTPQAHADKQSHILWALKGHVQRQRQEMMAQQHQLQQIQER